MQCILKRTLYLFAVATVFTACRPKLQKEMLYGSWKYVKIDHPNGDDPADTVTTTELNEQKPTITIRPQDRLIINWGGKVLSQGTFDIKDNNINYKEQLADGTTRTFPFYVSELDDKHIVFETLGKDGSRVKAIKE